MELFNLIDENTSRLGTKIFPLSDEVFNFKSNPKQWSIADVIQHLTLLEAAVNRLVTGSKSPAGEGDKTESIRETLLDPRPLDAGGFLSPKPGHKDKAECWEKFVLTRSSLMNDVRQEDFSSLCQDYNHVLFGKLTVGEWLFFVLYHSERHERQIDRVLAHLPLFSEK